MEMLDMDKIEKKVDEVEKQIEDAVRPAETAVETLIDDLEKKVPGVEKIVHVVDEQLGKLGCSVKLFGWILSLHKPPRPLSTTEAGVNTESS